MANGGRRPQSEVFIVLGAACIMLAIIGIIGWALWYRVPDGTTAAAVSTAPPPAAPAAAPNAEKKPATATPERADAKAGAPTLVAEKDAPAPRAARRAAPAPPVAAPTPAPPVATTGPPAAAKTPAAEAPAASNTSNAPSEARLRELGTGLTYSASDADVSPPIALTPQLQAMLTQASPGIRVDVLTIAVIVNEHGTVDSVRAVNLPLNLGESVMLTSALSAVKSWKFRPAVRDGAPVRYRQIVPVRIRDLVPQ